MILRDVVRVEYAGGHRIRVRFDDGIEGVVDVEQIVEFTGVFEPLRDATVFRQMTVHPELGVVCWPNGADLDSDVLYAKITGTSLPDCIPTEK